MHKRQNSSYLDPRKWGLDTSPDGTLMVNGYAVPDLAAQYGTPLHVVHETRLADTAAKFHNAFSHGYPGVASIHYAFKCNPVPGVIQILQRAGLKAEVMSEFELTLARQLGFQGSDIVVNGPFKPKSLLTACLKNQVRLIVVDSIAELLALNKLAGQFQTKASVLLRINPNYTPKGMNSGTATGSRKGCAFGLDLKSGEATAALHKLQELPHIQWKGLHLHIGTGIRYPVDYFNAISTLKPLVEAIKKMGREVAILDIGGGFATPNSREMTTLEMLYYQATNRLPRSFSNAARPEISHFSGKVTEGIARVFGGMKWPELIIEPGRSIASSNQMLLLTIHQVKDRPGAGHWLTTDGGIGTVAMPVFYEYHEVFLCNEVHRPKKRRVTINGPGCFAADVIYRNKHMPDVKPGEILAVMDSGAYFTSWESNFGYPRPAIIGIRHGKSRILRRRESFEEMINRDTPISQPTLSYLEGEIQPS